MKGSTGNYTILNNFLSHKTIWAALTCGGTGMHKKIASRTSPPLVEIIILQTNSPSLQCCNIIYVYTIYIIIYLFCMI